MKKGLCIVGAVGLIIGAAIAICLLNNKRKEHDAYPEYKEPEKKQVPVADEPLTKAAPVQEEPIYEDAKSSAIGSMYYRHEGAATIIRNSVETIRENVNVSENTNNEIDEVSAELDKMLSED